MVALASHLDDETIAEESGWEWVYDDAQPPSPSRKRTAAEAFGQQRITAARRGGLELRVGDTVRLKAERNETWVALITDFVDDEDSEDADDSSDDGLRGKKAVFLWFSSPRDVLNRQKKRMDFLPNEIYITSARDENPLETIEEKVIVCSYEDFLTRYPSGKIPKHSPDQGRLLVCRRGCNTRTATYTEEFVWNEIYQGPEDIERLQDRIEEQTQATRRKERDQMLLKPRHRQKTKYMDPDSFFGGDGANDQPSTGEPQTPKKPKLSDVGAVTPQSLRKLALTPRKLTTPSSKRIVAKKALTFTPLGTRILSTPPSNQSPHQQARTHLHVSAVPASLPCRENEFSEVYTHLESAISLGTGSCIYISGVPGTGKTATVREVIAALALARQEEQLDDFMFLEINGMKLTDPHQSYSLLWETLGGERLAPGHALTLLEREFSTPSPRRVPIVVLMDELDQLVTRSQSVMYNFFNWPGLRHARLIVLAVANTMDLPERTLSNKISSRLGLTRITFQGYTHTQLMQIIESRLEGLPGSVVDKDAVQFAARKVAQVSGDARRALDICRRAVEIAEEDVRAATAPDTPSKKASTEETAQDTLKGRVTIATIQRAIREATTSPLQLYLRQLPLATKLFLAALLARIRRAGVADATLADVVDEARSIGGMSGLPAINDFLLTSGGRDGRVDDDDDELDFTTNNEKRKRRVPRVLGMGAAAMELVQAGVVVVEEKRGERAAKIRLLVGEDEVKLALRNDEEVKGLGFSM